MGITLCLAFTLKAQPITIDGDFTDWNTIPYLHINAEGTGVPLTAIKVISGADDIYFYLEGTEALTFSAFDLYIDRDDNPATGFLSGGYPFGSGAELLIQGDVSPSSGNINVYTGSGADWSWDWLSGYNSEMNFSALITLTGKKAIEFSVKKSLLGTIGNHVGFALIGRVGWDPAGSIPALDQGQAYLRVSTADATLPVSLTSFAAKPYTDGVRLSWNTASEKNNSHFDIYRSVDGVNFEKIGFVNGNNNSLTLIAYTFTDKFPPSGQLYYQLEQVDFNGNKEKSPVVDINLPGKETAFYLRRIKDQELVEVTVYAEKNDSAQFLLSDVSGKILVNKSIDLIVGSQTINIPVKLNPGINIITLQTTTRSILQKILID